MRPVESIKAGDPLVLYRRAFMEHVRYGRSVPRLSPPAD
jgi:hypothetical protein